MKQLEAIMGELKEKNRKETEQLIQRSMQNVDCEEIDWGTFLVYKKAEEVVKKMLEKQQIQFFIAAAIDVKQAGADVSKVKISVISAEDEHTDKVLHAQQKGNLLVIFSLSKEMQEFLQ